MSNENRIQHLKAARALIQEAADGLGVPMLEAALNEADLNLHWALWNMGDEVDLLPERLN